VDRLYALFGNRAEGRPRAGWRLLLAVVVFLLAGIAAVVGAETLLIGLGWPSLATGAFSPPVLATTGITQLIAFGAATWLLAVGVDRRTIPDLGLRLSRRWWADLGFGLALGAGLQTGIFAVGLAAGWVEITGFATTDAPGASFVGWLALAAVGYLAVGIYEELLFRGYFLTNLAEGLARFDRRVAVGIAVLATSAVFSVLHGTNPNATATSVVSLTLAGIFLAVGFVYTGSLAIPIGIHITWNFFQGAVWGFPVSGVDTGVTIVATELTGPTVLTGGAFGPEAGLLGTAAKLVGVAAILAWVSRRHGRLRIDPGITEPELRREE
jgi:hypothetical protein